ncbi:MAG: prepilin-type N-terminal cleavage/methylation protein [Frankiales bacterium]|nr:prepilin-type N-terminal cleavage/methylation protein [Frankiales bacterium]
MNALLVRHRERLGDAGVTLVELLVAMVLMGVVGGLVVTAFASSARSQVRLSDETQGLTDLQTVIERLGRDLREARGVETSATQSQLTLWLDVNSDYAEQCTTERITWKLQATGDGSHFNVVRQVGDPSNPSSSSVVGHTLVDNVAFSYDGATAPAAPTSGPTVCGSTNRISPASTVGVTMTYDAIANGFTSARKAIFSTRLRNVQ